MKDNKYCFLSTNDIGDVGEVITAKTLRDDFGLTVVRTIYLPYKDKSVEIDMIAISDKGIFVIENKNYTGMVYGHVDSDYWKVKYADTTIRMFNPISQNYAHCLAVEDLLHTYNKKLKFPIFNIVIFNDKAKLCLKQPRNVYKISDFKKYYDSLSSSDIMSFSRRTKIMKLLYSFSDGSQERRDLHVESVRRNN